MKTKLKSHRIVYVLFLLIIFGVFMFFSGIPKVNYNDDNEIEEISGLGQGDLGSEASEAPFIVGINSGPTDLDPHYAYDSISLKVIDQVCENLYRFDISDPACPIISHLAAAFPTFSSDGLSLTIPLRTGVTFHDGSKFNATTVQWNLYRLMHFLNWEENSWLPEPWNVPLAPEVPITQLRNIFRTSMGEPIIDHIEILNEYTVKIVLREVKGSFLSLLSRMGGYMVSPESTPMFSYIDTNTGDLVGTGPFVYDGYELNQEVNFTAYEDYWDGKTDIAKMIFKIFLDQADLNDALLEGEIHFLDRVLDSMIDTFRTHPDIALIEEETVLNNYMGFNGYMVDTPFRQAISYTIDYSYLIDEILLGKGTRLKSPIPRGIPMSNYGFNYPMFDRAYAQSIMQSIGYGVGFTTDAEWLAVADSGGWGFQWNITTNIENTIRSEQALSISDNLRYLGIDAPVVQISWSELISCITHDVGPLRRDMIPMYMFGWTYDYIDPENYVSPLYSSRSSIWVNTYDEDLEQLMLEGETTGDYFARQSIYDEIQQKLVEELYFSAWISVGKKYYAMAKELKGFISNPLDIQYFYLCEWREYISEQIFTVGLINGPTYLDPHYAYDSISLKVIDQVCEGLYRFNISDPACPIIPQLATAFPTFSPDGLSLTIPLRTGVTFHDGSKFNATTVQWNLYRLMHFLNWDGNSWLPEPWNVPLAPEVPITQLSNIFKTSIGEPIIDHIEILNEYTIKIVLREVKGSFLSLLSRMGAYMVSPKSTPMHSYIDTNTGDLLGTGPFIYDGYEIDQELNFTAYEDYWDGKADIEKMIFRIFLDQTDLNNALLEGTIHFIDNTLDSMIHTFRTHPDITLIEEDTVLNNYMGFNGYMVWEPFREAISYAIDYSYLINEILLGKGTRLKSPIPRGIPMSNYGFDYPVFDRAYAQSIMQSMGFGVGFTTDEEWLAVADSGGWGFGWNITALTEGTTRKDLALSISDNLRYLGIDAPVVQIPFRDLITCMTHDDGPLRRDMIPMYMLGWTFDYIDPENYITPLYSTRSILSVNTYDFELEELMLEGETTGNYFAREPIYNEIQQKLVEELYFSVWISVGKRYYAMAKELKGFISNPLDIQYFYLCEWREDPFSGTRLIYGMSSAPQDLDPHYSWDAASIDIFDQVVETLFAHNLSDPDLKIIPRLALDYGTWSGDGLTYTVPLRTDVTFHDGTPFNAEAVVWNFERLRYFMDLDGSLPSDIPRTQFYGVFVWPDGTPKIDAVNIINEFEVEFVLSRPHAAFEALLCLSGAGMLSPNPLSTPEHEYIDTLSGDLIGTGPFVYGGYIDNYEVRFHAYENYWAGRASIGNLIFKIITDSFERTQALIDGNVDFVKSLDNSLLQALRDDPDITLSEGSTLYTNYMGFNGYMVWEPFREAISYAIDYSYLIDVILEGNGYRLKSPIPQGIPMSNYGFDYPVFDRAYAQSIMQSMGFGVGFTTDEEWLAVADSGGWGFGWNITTNIENVIRRDQTLSISDNLRYLGIDAPVVQIPFRDLITCMTHDDGPLRRDMIPMYMLGWGGDYIDPENYITPLYSSRSSFWVNTYDLELEELMFDGETTVDPVARQAIYDEIQQKLVEELYFSAWISTSKNYDAYSNNFIGFQPNPMDRVWFYPVWPKVLILSADMYVDGDGFVIPYDGITLDGGCYKLIGTGSGTGITLLNRHDVKITNFIIMGFDTGILIEGGSNNDVLVNYITENNIGISFSSTSGTTINNNIIAENLLGISAASPGNNIYLNLIINNDDQILDAGANTWMHPDDQLGNFWSNYWGDDLDGDWVGDTDLPHEGVDNYPLLDPSIPMRYDLLPLGGDWGLVTWLIWRGGWSPVEIQATDPLGRIISSDENQIGLDAFFVEDNEWEPGTTKVMVMIATSPAETGLWGDYRFQMTALENLDYSMEWFASNADGVLFERSVEDVPMTTGQTKQVVMTLEETPTGDIIVLPEPQYTFGGILQPINPDGSSIFKSGRTIPVKFQLYDDEGFPIGTAHATIDLIQISDKVEGDVWEFVWGGTPDEGNVFRYDEEDQQYIFNLSTKGLDIGTYLIRITLDDGQIFDIQISLR